MRFISHRQPLFQIVFSVTPHKPLSSPPLRTRVNEHKLRLSPSHPSNSDDFGKVYWFPQKAAPYLSSLFSGPRFPVHSKPCAFFLVKKVPPRINLRDSHPVSCFVPAGRRAFFDPYAHLPFPLMCFLATRATLSVGVLPLMGYRPEAPGEGFCSPALWFSCQHWGYSD